MRRLPITDLARLATLPDEKRIHVMRRMNGTFADFSYDPVRSAAPAIFSAELPLFGHVIEDWDSIRAGVLRACKNNEKARQPNLMVAKALYEFSIQNKIKAFDRDFGSFNVGMGYAVSYWMPLILQTSDGPCVAFIDPRHKATQMDLRAKHFAFSIMNEHIRVSNPDYSELGLLIFQFSDKRDGVRHAIVNKPENVPFYSYQELQKLTSRVFADWALVQSEMDDDKKRKAS